MKRILLKISGEALSGESGSIDAVKAQQLADMLCGVTQAGCQIMVVLGGGNIYRGSSLIASGLNPADSHNMSMLSTVFNAVTLKNFLEAQGQKVQVIDALGVEFLERYTSIQAKKYLGEGNIVIASSGSGSPFFTTDSAGALRAIETECEMMIKLTQVDGVYNSDPKTHPDAKRFDTISYDDFISQNLKVLDQTAIILARDNTLPIYVAKLGNAQSVLDIISGTGKATKIS